MKDEELDEFILQLYWRIEHGQGLQAREELKALLQERWSEAYDLGVKETTDRL